MYYVTFFLLDRMCENTESPSQGLTQFSQSSKHTVDDDFLIFISRTNIQGLKDCKEVRIYQHFKFCCLDECFDYFFFILKGNHLHIVWNH